MPRTKPIQVRREAGVAACDTEALVRASEQFAELELEMVRQTEVTAAQIAAEKADWAAVGTALGHVYQSLCDADDEAALEALRAIEAILRKRGILVPQPRVRPAEEPPKPVQDSLPLEPPPTAPEAQPQETEEEGPRDGE